MRLARKIIKLKRLLALLPLILNFKSYTSKADERNPSPEALKKIYEIQKKYKFDISNPFCIGDKEDPFEMGATMADGPYKGQCIDAEVNRPPFILDGTTSDYIEVANIRHADQWWIGRIEFGGVEKVYYEMVEFDNIVPGVRNGHVELRFVMKKDRPIKLRSQVVTIDKTEELDDLVVSYNAYGVHGVPFDAVQGIEKKFGLLGRLVSTYDRANHQIVFSKGVTSQIELQLDEHQKSLLLLRAIHRSDFLINYRTIYHTLFNNCATSSFDLIDDTIPRRAGVPDFIDEYSKWLGPIKDIFKNDWFAILPHIKDLIFQPSIDALGARGLIKGWGPTLNEEYNNGEVSLRKVQKHRGTIRNPDHPLVPTYN